MNVMSEAPLDDLEQRTRFRLDLKHAATRVAGPDSDLAEVLRSCGPIPRAAAFIGVARDGLPVLLNLRDPAPGPLLIVGDSGCGKRRLLQVVARSVDLLQSAADVRFAVLTAHPSQWEALGLSTNCEGVLPFQHPLTTGYVDSLAQMARSGTSMGRYFLLLVDGLEALAADPDLATDMHWLLETGPAQSIWPIASVDTLQAPGVADWLKPFRTVLCSRTSADQALAAGTKVAGEGHGLETPPSQFALLSGNEWLPFWVPEPL